MKPTYGAVSRYGMIAFASSLDQCGPLTRDVTDAALLFRHMVGRDPCDSTSLEFPEEVTLPSAESLDGVVFGVPPELTGEGVEPGVREVFERTTKLIEDLGRQARGGLASPLAVRHRRLLRDHAGGGERQPRPLRRRSLRAEGRGERRSAGPLRADARAGLRRRGQAPHPDRHLRALLGLLRRLLRPRPARAHEDRRGLQDRVREGGPDRDADLADRRVQARREDRRPARDVPERRAHRARCRWRASPRSRSLAACRRTCPWASSWPAPAFSENRILDAAYALEQSIGFEGVPVGSD